MGDALAALGRYDEALDAYRRSLPIRERLAAADPSNSQWQEDIGNGLDRVADSLFRLDRRADAIAAYRRSLELRDQQVATDRANGRLLRNFAVTANGLGAAMHAAGETDEAKAVYVRSLAATEALVALDPVNAFWQTDLQFVLNRLGEILIVLNNPEEAGELFRRGLAVAAALSAAEPENLMLLRNLSIGYERVGGTLLRVKQPLAATGSDLYGHALVIRERLLAREPDNRGRLHDLYLILANIADAENATGRSEPALAAYRRLAAVAEKLAAAEPADMAVRMKLHHALSRIGELLMVLGRRRGGCAASAPADAERAAGGGRAYCQPVEAADRDRIGSACTRRR